MTRPASDSPGLYLALQPGVKASIVEAARRLGVSIAAYVTELHEARDGKLLRPRRRLEVDAETPRKRRAKR